MSDKCFVDTNIFVYAHDNSGGIKHQRAQDLIGKLWVSGEGALSTQVLQELCINLRRKVRPALETQEIRSLLQDYLSWTVVANTGECVIEALDLEQRFKISFWDALILQSAMFCGANVLYSEDLSHGQRYGSVRAVNPLIST